MFPSDCSLGLQYLSFSHYGRPRCSRMWIGLPPRWPMICCSARKDSDGASPSRPTGASINLSSDYGLSHIKKCRVFIFRAQFEPSASRPSAIIRSHLKPIILQCQRMGMRITFSHLLWCTLSSSRIDLLEAFSKSRRIDSRITQGLSLVHGFSRSRHESFPA